MGVSESAVMHCQEMLPFDGFWLAAGAGKDEWCHNTPEGYKKCAMYSVGPFSMLNVATSICRRKILYEIYYITPFSFTCSLKPWFAAGMMFNQMIVSGIKVLYW